MSTCWKHFLSVPQPMKWQSTHDLKLYQNSWFFLNSKLSQSCWNSIQSPTIPVYSVSVRCTTILRASVHGLDVIVPAQSMRCVGLRGATESIKHHAVSLRCCVAVTTITETWEGCTRKSASGKLLSERLAGKPQVNTILSVWDAVQL